MIKVNPKGLSTLQGKMSFSLGVSMGSQNHEGDNLEAIVDWINSFGFRDGVVDLSDTLYRYSYISQGFSHNDALVKSQTDGDAWLKRNDEILARFKMPVRVVRWSNWLRQDKFSQYMEFFLSLYARDEAFKEAVDADIDRYQKRKYGASLQWENPNVYAQSVNYFCEELAAHSILFAEYPSVSVYPGRQLESYRLIRSGKAMAPTEGIKNSPYVRLCLYDGLESMAA